jgi:hypothetical protein
MSALSPYALILKIVGIAVACVAIVVLTMSWLSRGQEIDRLKEWQATVVTSTTDATVTPDAKGIRKALTPVQVPAAIAALKRSLDSATGALDDASANVEAAKQRADNADKALANSTLIFEQRYQSAEKRIAALDKRPAAADPAKACLNMTSDSKAAWEGWK